MNSTLRSFRALASTLVLLVAGGFLASSIARPLPQGASPAAQGHEDETRLGGIMQKMRNDMKQLKRDLEGKDQAAAWKSVCSIQQRILEAKQETPDSASSKPESQRAAFVDAFRTRISELLKRSCDLEAAILAGKLPEAGDVLGEMMGPMQKAGHKEFRND